MESVDHETNSYLMLTNHSSRTIKAGEQVMFFYSKRVSSYFLMHYGFCARDNRFDHFELVLKSDSETMAPQDMICWDLDDQTRNVKEFWLKTNKLDTEVLDYLRGKILPETTNASTTP